MEHPRYGFAGAIHILIFAGFLLLITRAGMVLGMGISDRFAGPVFPGPAGVAYDIVKDYAGARWCSSVSRSRHPATRL